MIARAATIGSDGRYPVQAVLLEAVARFVPAAVSGQTVVRDVPRPVEAAESAVNLYGGGRSLD